MRIILSGLLAIGLAGAMVACGSGDDNNSSPPGTTPDASSDGTTPTPGIDSGTPPGTDGSTPPGTDGGDSGIGPCNFATFVKGLVASDTTMTALPSTDLGQNCTDNQNQAEFQPLFP
ncbi:MAG TPA: hypothetical protein VH044_06240 [Polyangiaceae bacterium]|jgi:hypothetical protein|nr:hypothetical protein [Polyangiaceae bacterium]